MSGNQLKMPRRSVMAALGAGVLASAIGVDALAAPAGDKASLEKTVEAMRTAMVAGDGKVLSAVLHDHLTYSHSNTRQQTKAEVLEELAGKKAFASLALTEQTIDIVGGVGIIRHVFDSVNNLPEGKTSTAHIKVLQVWIVNGGNWQLLARASTPMPK